MKAITICNPYPELILLGEKPIENRDQPSPWDSYRGPFLIHAGKSRSWMGADDWKRYPNLSWGAIVGSADLVARLHIDSAWPAEFAHLKDHEHANGPHCLIVQNVKRLPKPVPCRGALGIWTVPTDVEALVREQLKAVA